MPQHVVFPSWSTCSVEREFHRLGARRARGCFHKKIGARQSVTDATAGDVEVGRLDLNSDEPAACLNGGNASRARTTERIGNDFA